jgi:hypothetical protein
MRVPGFAALNTEGGGWVISLSCGSPGNCSAGGWYENSSGEQAFLVNEIRGTWRRAEEVPGTASLNVGGLAQLSSVSCPSAGNCSAGGFYKTGLSFQAFVVNETDGRWGRAQDVLGTARLNMGNAFVDSVSCAADGNCSAGGGYHTRYGNEAFVVNERDGIWGRAEEVRGMATLNTDNNAEVLSVSCGSSGNCSAGGEYAASGQLQGFVVNESDGRWERAEAVRGIASTTASAQVESVSCSSPGNCSAGGVYSETDTHSQAFVVNETDGVWERAEEVPGTAVLNKGADAGINSVSCASPGNCSAGGFYAVRRGAKRALVVTETGGTWGVAEGVAGLERRDAEIESLSCGADRFCSAGGGYWGSSGGEAFVVDRTRGNWGRAEEVPGFGSLNKGGVGEMYSLSCPSARRCSGGGLFASSSSDGGASYWAQAFVVSRS